MKSAQEHAYTSTGIKFWRNPDQMHSYREGDGRTVISTHVSPEGVCNLKCPYCSVTHRKVSNRIDLGVIQSYITKLMTRGLRAVILTGGGEPTIYPHFSKLVDWIACKGLKVALITNGTQTHRVYDSMWSLFSWVRVSINLFDDWEKKIQLPVDLLSSDCVVGSSFVFTQRHEQPEQIDVDLLQRVARIARRSGAKYIRVLPNCLLEQHNLIRSHEILDGLLARVDDDLFFHQHKLHGAPDSDVCHQSYFRPYLSEVPYKGTTVPGSVYPCDSVVLNDALAEFIPDYQLCAPGDILDYMDNKVSHKFNPRKDCTGCVFTDNVNMLKQWKESGTNRFDEFPDPLVHEQFV